MIKNLFFVLLTSTFAIAQTGPTKTWVTPLENASFEIGEAINFELNYDAGDDGMTTDYVVGGGEPGLAAVQFSVQLLDESDPNNITTSWVQGKNDPTTTNTHSGTSIVSWTPTAVVTPSADLPAGQSYVIRAAYKNNASPVVWALGADDRPVTFTAAVTPTLPTTSWVNHPTGTMEQGTAYAFSAMYDAGNDGAGTNYTVGGTGSAHLQYSLAIVPGYAWTAGQNDPTTGGTESGTSSKDFTVGTAKGNGDPILPSDQLASGQSYVLRVGFRNSNDDWASGALEVPIELVAPGTLSVDDLSKSNLLTIYPNPTSGIVNISDSRDFKTISIHNLLGQEVMRVNAQKSIDISNLVKGVYFLNTDTGLTQKIVKK